MWITDTSNYITEQHNALSGWLYTNLCSMYDALGGTCEQAIGPLKENQVHVPLELHWPEGQLNMMGKIDQIRSSLTLVASDASLHENDDIVYSNTSSTTSNLNTIKGKIDALSSNVQKKVDTLSNDVQNKVDTVEGKVDALSNDKRDKVDTLSSDMRDKVDTLSSDVRDKVDAVESKVDTIQDELKELKEMMSKLMGIVAN